MPVVEVVVLAVFALPSLALALTVLLVRAAIDEIRGLLPGKERLREFLKRLAAERGTEKVHHVLVDKRTAAHGIPKICIAPIHENEYGCKPDAR